MESNTEVKPTLFSEFSLFSKKQSVEDESRFL